MMRHSWMILMLLFLGFSLAYGQRRSRMVQMNNERIESMRIAHYSNQMSLSSKEAQVFWPWFNERDAKLKETRKEKNMKVRQMQQASAAEDEQAIEKIIDDYMSLKIRESQIEKDYHDELKKILPIRKVVMFYKAEKGWEKKIIKFLQERRE